MYAMFSFCNNGIQHTHTHLHATFLGLDISDTVHLFVMGLYIAAR